MYIEYINSLKYSLRLLLEITNNLLMLVVIVYAHNLITVIQWPPNDIVLPKLLIKCSYYVTKTMDSQM